MKTANKLNYQTDVTVTVFVNEAVEYVLWIDAHDRLIASDENGKNEIITGSERNKLLRIHGYEEFITAGPGRTVTIEPVLCKLDENHQDLQVDIPSKDLQLYDSVQYSNQLYFVAVADGKSVHEGGETA